MQDAKEGNSLCIPEAWGQDELQKNIPGAGRKRPEVILRYCGKHQVFGVKRDATLDQISTILAGRKPLKKRPLTAA